MKHAPIPLALAFWVLTAAHAASAPAPPANLVDCSQMSDPGERLKCYDTQMAAMKAAAGAASVTPPAAGPSAVSPPPVAAAAPKTQVPAAAAAPAPAPASATAVTEPTPEQKFGAIDLPRVARDKVYKPDEALLSTIASIHQVRPKLWLIVLANGQTWLQDGTQITMFFRPGYDVRIEKGLLDGEFRMSTAQTGVKNWVRVSRIQ